ncbi:DnaD domain-containing protein [Salinicoccus roseus]|uniref:DnaD domain protein n=1 Tax=Salinicoccus roseus TaxID=45670 RepID=A0A0C2HKE5_9STAP|nr:DnaD domain protein [Salinicoccus roseus]KIH70056.1 hypothetical protein SN16_11175 [Salinicoccus roseus]MDB0581364.1 DnaD domain protein [Salinicoccus roseus]
MTGWISLHRSIENHWLFKEDRKFSKFEAWVDLLLMVNHKDKKILLGSELALVRRGQKITSLRKLSERWQWSITKVDRFLKLLESDEMITVKKDSKKTVVSIVNYDIYQNQDLEKRHRKDSNETPTIQEEDTDDTRTKTNNNVNNANNDSIRRNKEDKQEQQSNYEKRVGRIFKAYEYFGFGVTPAAANDQVVDWLEKHSPEVIIEALREAYNENKKKNNYVNRILTRWKADGLDTVEKIKADKKQFELSKSDTQKPQSYQQKMRERPGEVTPGWMKEEKRKPESPSEPVKTAAEDPEIQKMIAEFRNGG